MSGMAMRRTPLTKFFNPGGQAWLRLHHTNLVLLGLGLDHPDLLLLVGLGIQRTDVVLIHLELKPCLCHQLCQFMFCIVQQQLNEDNRQALVLFGIVVIFFVSNVPRILLNLHEVFTIDDYKEELSKGCTNLPLWVLLSGNFSQLFMVANSSLNFFIYCFMSSVFRGVFIGNLGLCLSPISAPLQRMGKI